MSTSIADPSRILGAGVSLAAASLIAWGAGSTVAGTPGASATAAAPGATADVGSAAASTPFASAARGGPPVRIALTVDGEGLATATLADTPAAREFAMDLPVTIATEDRFGQAKAGPLPGDLSYGGADRVLDPVAGGLYFWPPDGTFVVFTTDLGPAVPTPGLVPLAVVDTGLGTLDSAGNRFELTVDLAD